MDRKDRVLAQDKRPKLDPAFRLAVLERRARQIFRRQLIATLLAALAFTLALAIAVQASSSMESAGLLVLGAGLVVSWQFYAPVLAHVMRTALTMSKER